MRSLPLLKGCVSSSYRLEGIAVGEQARSSVTGSLSRFGPPSLRHDTRTAGSAPAAQRFLRGAE